MGQKGRENYIKNGICGNRHARGNWCQERLFCLKQHVFKFILWLVFFYHNYFIQFNPSHACYQLNKYFKFIFCDCQSPFITQIVHHSCLKSDGSSNILDHQCTDKEWLWLASIMSTKHRSFQRLQETIVWSWKIPREHFSRNHMETSKTVSLPRLLVTT